MAKSSLAIRLGFAVAAATAAMALALHIQNWHRGAAFNWPVVASMSGLIILMAIGAIDPPRGPLRIALSAIAIIFIFIGFVGALFPAFSQ